MTEKELKKSNPCGEDKEIDEYLDGTICEIKVGEEELNDIKAPTGENFEVDSPDEPEALHDEYVGEL
jgi:hypothetical protein